MGVSTEKHRERDLSITPATQLYCLLGRPVSHSMGPLVHNMLFNEFGIDAVYLAFELNDIKKGVESIRALGIRGASVTIPFKERILEYLDSIDEMALKIGAVNTVLNQDGYLVGSNTDCAGAIEPLKAASGTVKGKHVCIIGAGGAARAVAFGVRNEGGHITILNRTREKGEQLAMQVNGDFLQYDAGMTSGKMVSGVQCQTPESSLPDTLINGVDILINTTSVGMVPDSDKSPVNSSLLHENLTVMDIVYNPLRTKLLQDAQYANCKTVDGLAMFIHQGAAQFELFTGIKPPLHLMRETLLRKMGAKQ